jgi:serine/threonine-protein kinase
LPFKGANTLELIVNKEKGTFTPARRLNSQVPEKLDLMIDKMMMKDPQHRYADCASLIKDLTGLNLASPALSFIEGAEEVAVSRIGGAGSRAQTTKVPTRTKAATSADDAAKTEAAQLDANKKWYVRHTNPQGKPIISRMTAPQILQGIRGGLLDLKAQAKPEAHGNFMPLAQFKEFTSAVNTVVTKVQAEARSTDMQSMYSKLDKQHRNRNRWNWLKKIFSGVKGGVSLILWLGFIAAVGVGLFFAYKYGWPMLQEQLNLK